MKNISLKRSLKAERTCEGLARKLNKFAGNKNIRKAIALLHRAQTLIQKSTPISK